MTLTVGSGVPFYYNSGHAAFYRYFNISARPGAPSILRVGRAAVPVGSMEHAWPQQTSQQRTRPPPSLTRRRCHSALASLTDTCAHAHAHVTCHMHMHMHMHMCTGQHVERLAYYLVGPTKACSVLVVHYYYYYYYCPAPAHVEV